MKEKRKKKIIIFSLLGLLCLMTVGYAAFNTNLNVKGTSSISSNWDIRITDVSVGEIHGDAENTKAPTWNELTANVEADLYSKGDYIEYIVTVENKGTVDAVLSNVTTKESDNEAVKITFSGVNINDRLFKGESVQIKVKVEYNPEYSGETPAGSGESTITLDYTQAEIAGEAVLNPNLYVSSKGSDTEGNGSKSNPYLTIAKAYSVASDDSTIYIMDDIAQTETLNLNEDKDITITSDGNIHKILRNNTDNNHLINISDGNITLQNIIVDGNKVDMEYGLIGLNNNCYLTLGSNTVLTNAIANYWNGGAIRFNDGSFATLEINGATISNNEAPAAGAIHIVSGGTVIMNSGLITGNKSLTGRGGAIYNYGNILINGGTISNNTAQNGGAIFNSYAKITIDGGNIIDNKALNSESACGGAIYNQAGTININDGKISENSSTYRGGGIYTTGTLTINGGEISDNTTSSDGGGIAEADESIKQYTTINGGTIKNNTANLRGGGIWDNDKVTIEGGTITGNKAKYGAGILLNGGSTLILNKGTITGNIASSLGGGVFISSYSTTFTNNIIINGNTPDNTHKGNEHAS